MWKRIKYGLNNVSLPIKFILKGGIVEIIINPPFDHIVFLSIFLA